MNYVNVALTLFSFRKELQYVTLAFLVILMMPVIAVFLLTHSGIDIISDRLATVDTQTQAIEIHDPVTINQVIGNRGTTGWSTGPHLHFQINVYGLPVDPRTFMGNLANGVPIEEAPPQDH